MDLRFVGTLFIFGGSLVAVFLHCLGRFLLRRNLKGLCKSQELPGPPHKCDSLLDSYFPTNTPANFLDWGSGRAPANEHQYRCLSSSFPESAKPLSRRDLCGPPPPHSSEHDLPESSDPADIRESFKTKGALPMGPMGPLPSSPMGPIDKGYVKDFPVVDLPSKTKGALPFKTKGALRESFKTKGPLPLGSMGRLPSSPMGPLPLSSLGLPMGPLPLGSMRLPTGLPMGPLPLSSLGLPMGPLPLGSMGLPSSPMGPLPLISLGLPMGLPMGPPPLSSLGLPMGPLPLGSMGLPSSPMGRMGPIDKGYVKDFPVADLHRNRMLAAGMHTEKLWALQNWTRAAAMNKLPGISAAATSVTGCDSAHVIGMDECKDSLLRSQLEKH